MSDQSRPMSYDEVVERFDLILLRKRGDLVIEDGDLALTRWGDLRVGTIAYQGLMRLVQYWRYNEGTLRHLFEATYAVARRLLDNRERYERPVEVDLSNLDFEKFRKAVLPRLDSEAESALEFGQRTYAGSLVFALSGLLQQFKDDIKATNDEWAEAPPSYQNCSFGQLVIAAANGVRHADEWVKAQVPSPQQLASMNILRTVLGQGTNRFTFTSNIPAGTLDVLSDGGDFDRMNASMFAFAHDVAQRREARVC